MTKIAICGDSWFSADTELPGKSFGEVMCTKNNWTLLSLARGGCSNFGISLQVDKAIECNADFVVLGTTTPDRGEFPIINAQNKSIWEKLKNSFNWKDWFVLQPEVYTKSRGISNVLHDESLSKTYSWIDNPTIIAEPLNNLTLGSFKNKHLTDEQYQALRLFMLNLYDSGIKRQYDSWIISDACRRLVHAEIPFLIFIESLYQWDYSKDIDWVPEKNVVRPRDFSIWNDIPRSNTPFHYCVNSGSDIFSTYVETRIKNLIK